MIKNNKGFALITTLILSAVGLAFIAGLIYMAKTGVETSTSLKSYKSTLAINKGASDYVMAGIHSDNVGCNDNATVINSFLSQYKEETPGYDIDVLNYECNSFDSDTKEIYLIQIQVTKQNNKEKSIVEFGYYVDYAD